MSDFRHLSDQRVGEIYEAALSCSLYHLDTQSALFASLGPELHAQFVTSKVPAEQLKSTVHKLNSIERNEGVIPFVVWLKNAILRSFHLKQSEVFEAALEDIIKGPPYSAQPQERVSYWQIFLERYPALTDQIAQLRAIAQQTQDDETLREKMGELRDLLRKGRLSPGDTLCGGRFTLDKELGSGGFATVWRARDNQQRSTVAIKVLRSRFTDSPVEQDRFFEGARRMAELHHPNIVEIILKDGQGTNRDGAPIHYIVMEYMEGGDFENFIDKEKPGLRQVVPVIAQVAKALDELHSRGMIHRDVSPDNILLAGNIAKLSDFDLLHIAEGAEWTVTKQAMGKMVFSSPEAKSDAGSVDKRADIYSLAMTAAFAVDPEHVRRNFHRRGSQVVNSVNCPPSVAEVFRKATAMAPEKRHQTASEFVAELQQAFEQPNIGVQNISILFVFVLLLSVGAIAIQQKDAAPQVPVPAPITSPSSISSAIPGSTASHASTLFTVSEHCPPGTLRKLNLWKPGQKITVGFMNGDKKIQAMVMRVAREWLEKANLNLEAAPTNISDIKISFKSNECKHDYSQDGPRTSTSQGQPTMCLSGVEMSNKENDNRFIILRVFGFAFGLVDELSNPDVINDKEIWEISTKHYLFYRGQPQYAPCPLNVPYRDFTRDSAMLYIPGEYTQDGRPIGGQGELSQSDKDLLGRLYPGK